MKLSLPLRLNLVNFIFTTFITIALISTGATLLYTQSEENAVKRAEFIASELSQRASRLLELGLSFDNFYGFDEQCRAVLKNDPLMKRSSIFDSSGYYSYQSDSSDLDFIGALIRESQIQTTTQFHLHSENFIIRPFSIIPNQIDGYTAIFFDTEEFLKISFRPVLLLVLVALLFSFISIFFQQILLRKFVGIPLADLVSIADSLHSASPAQMSVLEQRTSTDDIGKIYGALNRLLYRLMDATNKLIDRNYEQEKIIKRRTRELEEANNRLAEDLQQRIELEEQLRSLAGSDTLTGLPNRTTISERLSIMLSEAERHHWKTAILFIDLDNFKLINDTLGHDTGDKLLIEISHRLTGIVRRTDFVARLGGDEFMVILPDIKSPLNSGHIACKIIEGLNSPILVDNRPLHIGCSIGISIAPDDTKDALTLMKSADTAMYHAKNIGKNNYQFFTSVMMENVQKQLAFEIQLKSSIKNEELFLCYQPVIKTNTMEIISFEALLRWKPINGIIIYPEEFIPIAEDTSLIISIGNWVLEEVFKQAHEWQAKGVIFSKISINISHLQLLSESFIEMVKKLLLTYSIQPSKIIFEIKEKVLLQKPIEPIKRLMQLSEMGIIFSIDDFGTGYSSLSYLHEFPINIVKIDRSFISSLNSSENNKKITNAIIRLCESLDLIAIAKGVDNNVDLEILRQMGNTFVQGTIFSKPMLPSEVPSFITSFYDNQLFLF